MDTLAAPLPLPGEAPVQRIIKVRRDYNSWVAREGAHRRAPAERARETPGAQHARRFRLRRTITVRVSDGKLMWQTLLERELLQQHYGTCGPQYAGGGADLAAAQPGRCRKADWAAAPGLQKHRLGGAPADDDWVIIMREDSDDTVIQVMSLSFKLRPGEASSAASAGR